MIYFDNAATSGARPYSVINSAMFAIKNMSANPGRSGHKLSLECGKMITDTRVKLNSFFSGYSLSNVVFTKNCTEALNLSILGCLKQGGHVITTANEHNSVLRPLYELEKSGLISLTVIFPQIDGTISPIDIEKAINKDTYLVAVCHASNVTGATSDIFQIGQLCQKHNLLFLVDAAQSAGHIKIDMQSSNIDMLCFAGHKGLYAIQGSGGLLFSQNANLKPVMFGGTGTDSDQLYQPTYSPEGFESGTLNTPAIASLNTSLDYLMTNFEKHQKTLYDIQTYLYENILQMPNFSIFSSKNNCGIITISHKTYSSIDIAQILNDKYNIAIRSGLHCAPLIHTHLGTLQTGLARISASVFNTKQDCDRLIYALKSIK